jgi:hypothetical protein
VDEVLKRLGNQDGYTQKLSFRSRQRGLEEDSRALPLRRVPGRRQAGHALQDNLAAAMEHYSVLGCKSDRVISYWLTGLMLDATNSAQGQGELRFVAK